MTDEKVQELTDKYLNAPFMRISEIVREAYLAGEKAGLEEAAELARALMALKNKTQLIAKAVDPFICLASVRAGKDLYVGGPCMEPEVSIAHQVLSRPSIAKLLNPPPAAISDCATSAVEAARNTSKLAAKKEKA